MIDPQKAFVAFLRTTFPTMTVGTALTGARPAFVVEILPGGTTELRRHIDQVRLNVISYGDGTFDPRTLAGQARAAILGGFTAGGQRVFRVDADPPFPLVDATTYETRWYLPVTALLHAQEGAA